MPPGAPGPRSGAESVAHGEEDQRDQAPPQLTEAEGLRAELGTARGQAVGRPPQEQDEGQHSEPGTPVGPQARPVAPAMARTWLPRASRDPRRETPVEAETGANEEDRGDRPQGQQGPGPVGQLARGAPRPGRWPTPRPPGPPRRRLPAGPRGCGRARRRPGPRAPAGAPRASAGQKGARREGPGGGHESQGHSGVAEDEAHGERRCGGARPRAAVHQDQRRGCRTRNAATAATPRQQASRRRREDQPEHDRLEEETPAAVLDGQRDRPPRDRRGGVAVLTGKKTSTPPESRHGE